MREAGFVSRRSMLVGCALAATAGPALASAAAASTGRPVADRLQKVLDEQLTGDMPGIAMRVEAPGLRWSGAVGTVTLGGSQPLPPGASFRISSVTKTFTAVVVLRLVERGRLRLDDLLSAHVEPGLVDRLNVIDGVSTGARITVRQLLNHTSGVFDYAQHPAYAEAVAADPRHQWTRLEQIEFGLAHGKPYFPAGQGYHYSDTGYLLLGMIAEAVTGRSLPTLTRRLVIEPACLRHTYTEQLEPPRPPERTHQYVGPADVTDFNPSFDLYGGGGLVSTAGDLARFGQALFGARLVFPHTLDQMLTSSEFGSYGLGLDRFPLDGETVWGHTGFLGAFLLYWPNRRLLITGCVNQAEADSIAPAEAIARAL